MDTNANTNLMPIYQLGIADYAIFVLMLLISGKFKIIKLIKNFK